MITSAPEVRVLETASDLFRAAAGEWSTLSAEAIRAKGAFTVALSGGSTPKSLYALLASSSAPMLAWDKTYFFWGDERHVPPDHPESNYRMVNEAMLSKVTVPAQNIFRIHAEEADANAAASSYEQTLKDFFRLRPGEFPRFDLTLLGIGPDGHTASLFPGTPALQEKRRLVIANWIPKFNAYRITFTYPVLNQSACVMFLVSGKDKSEILREVLENPSANLPSQNVRPTHGRLLWLVDRAATSSLRSQKS
jgi:6-phosphogluconolactonase